MTPLAEILKPHMSLIVGALVFMFGLAIFVGVLMVLRRLWSRELGPGERIQDPEQLAAELHEEIIRLEELRDRLDPSYSLLGHDVSARPVKSKLSSPDDEEDSKVKPEAELAEVPSKSAKDSKNSNDAEKDQENSEEESKAPPSEDYIKVAVKQATAELNKEITELNAQIQKMKAEASSVDPAEPEATPAGGGTVSDEKLVKEVAQLEAKLEDYQAFEDEIALVKTYKEEIEKLQARIKEMETGQPQITDDDIASLFSEMGGEDAEDGASSESAEDLSSAEADTGEEILKVEASPEEGAETQVFKADHVEPTPEPTVFSGSSEDEVIEPEPEVEVEPELVAAAPDNTSSDEMQDLKVGEETAEAYAELGDEGDELLAEFEKVLSSKEDTP